MGAQDLSLRASVVSSSSLRPRVASCYCSESLQDSYTYTCSRVPLLISSLTPTLVTYYCITLQYFGGPYRERWVHLWSSTHCPSTPRLLRHCCLHFDTLLFRQGQIHTYTLLPSTLLLFSSSSSFSVCWVVTSGAAHCTCVSLPLSLSHSQSIGYFSFWLYTHFPYPITYACTPPFLQTLVHKHSRTHL